MMRGLIRLSLLVFSLPVMAQVRIEQTNCFGWPNCYRVGNPQIELLATTDVGPRIISLSFKGEKNVFYVREDFAGKTGGEEWRNYGGHRLWHAPEEKVRTYRQDNAPIEAVEIPNGLRLTAAVEKGTGIQKIIEVTLDPAQAKARVIHRLKNTGLWRVELAPWALSVMAPGGFAISPLPTRFHPDRLLPNRTLVLWPYTDLRDPRYYLGTDFVMLRHQAGIDPSRERAKIGIANDDGWCAYSIEGYLFVKRFKFVEGAQYPDRGVSVELFTNNRMLELETLGPLVTLAPGEEVAYEERWELYKNIPVTFGTEESVKASLLPLIK